MPDRLFGLVIGKYLDSDRARCQMLFAMHPEAKQLELPLRMEPTEDEKFEAWKRHYEGKYYKDSPYNDPNYVRPKGKRGKVK